MLIRLKSSSLVLVLIGSMLMVICNRFHERLANNGKMTFTGIPLFDALVPSCAGFLEPRESRLGPSKSTFNAENFICSLSMSLSIDFAHFALEMCLATRNRQKINLKTLFWRSRSSKVIEFGANREPVCDFLLVINSRPNLGPILHRYWDAGDLLAKNREFFPISPHLALSFGVTPFEFMEKSLPSSRP